MSHIDVARDQTQVRVKVMMHLNETEIPALQQAVRQEIQTGAQEVVFDMADTVSLDAAGICFFMAASNSLSAVQGRVRLLNVSGNILKLLRTLRLADCLNALGTGTEVAHG